jgi:hypothetical protein
MCSCAKNLATMFLINNQRTLFWKFGKSIKARLSTSAAYDPAHPYRQTWADSLQLLYLRRSSRGIQGVGVATGQTH